MYRRVGLGSRILRTSSGYKTGNSEVSVGSIFKYAAYGHSYSFAAISNKHTVHKAAKLWFIAV